MKKSLVIILLISLLCLFGCSTKEEFALNNDENVLTCTKSEKDDFGYDVFETMKISYKDDMVIKVEQSSVEEADIEYIDATLSLGQLVASQYNKIDGIEVSYSKEGKNKIKYTMVVDFQKVDLDKLKEAFGEDFEDDSFYSTKDITLEQFKTNNLEGFDCK